MEGLALADKVTCDAPFVWTGRGIKPAVLADGRYDWPGSGPRVVVFDMGLKWNIMRLLTAQGFDLLMVPYTTTADQVRRLAPDAIFLSPGPGDPAALPGLVATAAKLVDDYPVAGICLGASASGLGSGAGGPTNSSSATMASIIRSRIWKPDVLKFRRKIMVFAWTSKACPT